jgi:hypothetical protein
VWARAERRRPELLVHCRGILWPVPHAAASVHRDDDRADGPDGSCPNPRWTATVTDVAFTTATISLFAARRGLRVRMCQSANIG